MNKDDAKFYWAIIGDSQPEPVAVTGKIGARWAYTIGCPDPFAVDAPDSNIQLLHAPGANCRKYNFDRGEYEPLPVAPMLIPKTPTEEAEERAAAERRLEADAKKGIRHGYAGFGRRAS